MDACKGRYSLIQDSCDGKEVFDFSKDVMDFLPEKDAFLSRVSVATIDTLTTSFSNALLLNSYLKNGRYDNREDSQAKTIIGYKNKENADISYLDTVWDDEILHEVASHTSGSTVDFNNATTKRTFFTIYKELIKKDSSLADRLLASTSNTTSLNAYNRKLVSLVHSSPYSYFNSQEEKRIFDKMVESFSSYREYRALYIAHKRYIMSMKKEVPLQLLKK